MNKKLLTLIISIMLVSTITYGQNIKLNLYPDGEIPNFKQTDEVEVWDTTNAVRIKTVQMPDIVVFLPSKGIATGEAVVICPGGGYHILAYDKEGEDVAKMFNAQGIAAVVLKYRLPSSKAQIIPHKSPLMDAQRAMRMVRYNAEKWNIEPTKIGIMGFSAGGHLASSLSTHFDAGNPEATDPIEKVSCRPDFSLLIYPVITMTEDFQHQGSRKALVGEDPELMKYYSSEKQITAETPPALLIHSSADKSVPVNNSIYYFQELVKNNIKAEMHIYPYGGHGFGMAVNKGYLSTWTERAVDFVKGLK